MSSSTVVPFRPGRPAGIPNKATTVARIVALRLLESPEYVASLKERIKAGTLAPAVEKMLWAYAYGKPIDRVELVPVGAKSLSEMSAEELASRADEIAARARQREEEWRRAHAQLAEQLEAKREAELRKAARAILAEEAAADAAEAARERDPSA